MKIILASTVYPPENGWGGIGTYVYHAARGLKSIGHDVTIVCGYKTDSYTREEDGIRVIRKVRIENSSPEDISEQFCKIIESEIKQNTIDAVEFCEYGAIGLAFQRKHPDFPTVVKLHGSSMQCALGGCSSGKAFLKQFYVRPSLRQMDRDERESAVRAHVLIAPSQWEFDELRREGWQFPEDVEVVRNPFGGWPAQDFPLSDKQYSEKRILFLGRLDKRKGADFIPKVLKMVWEADPQAQFSVLGQDSLKSKGITWSQWIYDQIPFQFKNQCTYLGGIPYLQVSSHLKNHTIAAFASTWENLPYATMECMWAGIACIIGSEGGAHELIEDGISGFGVPRKATFIAERIIKLLQNPKKVEKMGKNAHQHAAREFGCSKIAQQMENIYQRAIQRTKEMGV